MTTHKAVLASMLLTGAASSVLAQGYQRQPAPQQVPPPAQQQPAQAQAPAQPARQYNLSRQERTAFAPVITAVTAQDWATATTALAAAAQQASGNDAKYLVGQIRLQIGIGTQDRAQQSQAIDEMLASGGALPTELRALYENQLAFANAAGDTAKAQRAMAELDRLNPNDPNRVLRQAQAKVDARDPTGAIGIFQQAIQAKQQAGQPVPVEWRQRIAAIAWTARLPDTVRYWRELLVAAPTPAVWHDILTVYAEINHADSALKLDTYRLMRAAGLMTGERDFVELFQAANAVRAFGEVQAVIQDGLQRNLIVQNAAYARETLTLATRRATDDRTTLAESRRSALAGNAAAALNMGDAYYGYGEYAQAAELYRAALQKGAEASLGNVRLGAALAMAGQRAEAEAAFRTVTSGPRAELAQLWLLWLSTRQG